jgi:hypothetical protein
MNKAIIYMDGKRRKSYRLEEDSEFEEALQKIEFHFLNETLEVIGIVSCEQAEAWLDAPRLNTPDPAMEGELDAIENVRYLGASMDFIRNGMKKIKPGTAWKVFRAKNLCEYFYYQETEVQHRKFGIDAAAEAFHIAERHFWKTVKEEVL